MPMYPTRITLLTLTAGASLALACAAGPSAKATASSSHPTANSTANSTATAAPSAPHPADYTYAYTYDYDNDGGYAGKRASLEATTEDTTLAQVTVPVVVPFAIDSTLQQACTLAKPTFYFEFDSSKLPSDVDNDFENIVECLQHESLDDSAIEVIGHADERGTKDYNRDLGRERADAVASELQAAGLSRDRIAVVSKGERDADAPEYWDDRRVVIRLK